MELKTRIKVAITTLIVGVPAFLVAQATWPSPAAQGQLPALWAPFLVLPVALESLGLGLGVAFALFGWRRLVRNSGSPRARTLAVCASVSWLLASPWPYDYLRRQAAAEGLMYMEYGFHATLLACGIVLAYSALHNDPPLKEIRRMIRISSS